MTNYSAVNHANARSARRSMVSVTRRLVNARVCQTLSAINAKSQPVITSLLICIS